MYSRLALNSLCDKDNLGLLTLLPLSHKYQDYNMHHHAMFYVVLGKEHTASCVLGKHSTS